MAITVVCVLNVDLGANFYDFCLSNAIHCMGQDIKSIAACVRLSVCVRAYGISGKRFQSDKNRKWHSANRWSRDR